MFAAVKARVGFRPLAGTVFSSSACGSSLVCDSFCLFDPSSPTRNVSWTTKDLGDSTKVILDVALLLSLSVSTRFFQSEVRLGLREGAIGFVALLRSVR